MWSAARDIDSVDCRLSRRHNGSTATRRAYSVRGSLLPLLTGYIYILKKYNEANDNNIVCQALSDTDCQFTTAID